MLGWRLSVHSDVTCGSDGPSCFKTKAKILFTAILPSVYHTHLKRTAWGSGSTPGHGCPKGSNGWGTPTVWCNLFVSLYKVTFVRIFGRSLTRVGDSTILWEGSNQIVVFDKWTLASLTFWLWRFRTIFWRDLSRYSMRSPHSYSTWLSILLNRSCWPSSLWHRLSFTRLLLAYLCLRAIYYLIIPRQVIWLSSKTRTFRSIPQYDIPGLYHLRHSPGNPGLISPTKGLGHWMLIEFVWILLISTPKYAISLINYLIGF